MNYLDMEKDGYVADVCVLERFDTGVPKLLASEGIRFAWSDWLLCEMSLREGNVLHHVITTDFRCRWENGIDPDVTGLIWNPTYDHPVQSQQRLRDLYVWRPVLNVTRAVADPAGLFERILDVEERADDRR